MNCILIKFFLKKEKKVRLFLAKIHLKNFVISERDHIDEPKVKICFQVKLVLQVLNLKLVSDFEHFFKKFSV